MSFPSFFVIRDISRTDSIGVNFLDIIHNTIFVKKFHSFLSMASAHQL